MGCKEKLENYLRENKVPYQTQHHAEVFTAHEVAASEHIPGKLVAKVVMAVADGQLVMLVLPATHQVDLGKAAKAVGAKEVRLAREDEFEKSFPECQVGAMPPFGNLYGLPVYVDEALAEDPYIVFQAGTHTDTMSLRYADFTRLVNPRIARFGRQA